MSKKQQKSVPKIDTRGGAADNSRGDIKKIRELTQILSEIPEGATLPNWTHLSINERFSAAVRLLGKTRADWTQALGKSDRMLDRYGELGGIIPDEVVGALAAKAALPANWIRTGREMERQPPLKVGSAEELLAPDSDVPLQKLAFRASAGPGHIAVDEGAEYVRFPRSILNYIGVKPQHAKLLESDGLSMHPTIDDGDTLVVDVSQTAISDGNVYAFAVGDHVHVKRLRRGPDAVYMISDNKELFPNEERIPADVRLQIFGRVKFTGRKL